MFFNFLFLQVNCNNTIFTNTSKLAIGLGGDMSWVIEV